MPTPIFWFNNKVEWITVAPLQDIAYITHNPNLNYREKVLGVSQVLGIRYMCYQVNRTQLYCCKQGKLLFIVFLGGHLDPDYQDLPTW